MRRGEIKKRERHGVEWDREDDRSEVRDKDPNGNWKKKKLEREK